MEHFIGAIKKYADFTGRARRTEYWMFTLFYIIFSLVVSAIDYALGTTVLGLIYSLGLLLPLLRLPRVVCTTLTAVVGGSCWHLSLS